MKLYQFNWKINLFKGDIIFFEGKRKIGQVKLLGLLTKSCVIELKNERYISHPEIFTHNRIRLYNSSNNRQLAILTFKLWNSSVQLTYKREQFQLKSSFLGVLGTHWIQQHTIPVLAFNNQVLNGFITDPIPDEEKYHLLIIAAIQSMLFYSFIFLLMLIVVLYVIL